MARSIQFRSKAFPAQPGEEHEVNPGRYGKAVAQFLADALRRRGFHILGPSPEDWGWRIDVGNDDFPLWIGCGNLDGEEDGFLCFVEPAKATAGTWPRRKDTRPVTDRLANEVYDVLTANLHVEQVQWSD
jgi:hypothetical protein